MPLIGSINRKELKTLEVKTHFLAGFDFSLISPDSHLEQHRGNCRQDLAHVDLLLSAMSLLLPQLKAERSNNSYLFYFDLISSWWKTFNTQFICLSLSVSFCVFSLGKIKEKIYWATGSDAFYDWDLFGLTWTSFCTVCNKIHPINLLRFQSEETGE